MKDRSHDEAMAEMFRQDPAFAADYAAHVLRCGEPADLEVAKRQGALTMDPTLFADLVRSLKEARDIADGKVPAPRRFKHEPADVTALQKKAEPRESGGDAAND